MKNIRTTAKATQTRSTYKDSTTSDNINSITKAT